ncbi:MAG TPA: NUDIX hydrolase [Verrucomicrobiae bacterium]|nr:NUDIX hydrolase [Verrucomicrobiae bacterium]
MTSPIPRPVDAAGLVLLRGGRDDPEVLLGRRHARAGFLPDIYVFPGGRVEPGDGRGRPLPLAPPVAAGLAWASRRPAAAFVRAALRETAEESGLSLPPEAVEGIDFICRAITPTRSHRRYNTRFLLADGAACRGALAGDGELEDLGWHRHSEVGRLKLVDVTNFVLEEAVRRWRLALRPGAEPAVRYSYAGGRVRILRRPLL